MWESGETGGVGVRVARAVAIAIAVVSTSTACVDGLPLLGSNERPSADIRSPSDGASFLEGGAVTFEGSATDPEDGQLTGGSLAWSSDVDGQLGTGETVTAGGLSVGEHTVTLTATDSDGKSNEATVTITVEANEPPSASIASPADGASFLEGGAVTFEGSATDPEDGQLTGGSLAWSSDVDGQLGTGETVTAGGLSVGEHTVTLTATDSDGKSDEATVTITVEANRPPSASIANPADGASFAEGETVTFEGSATDPEDGQLTGGSLVWRSDLDGELGTGETVTAGGLSVGEHTVTLTATDSRGATGEATVTITVEANRPPSASIANPADGASFAEGETVTFEGSATDPEDGQLTGGSLVWRSDLDGELGTGETVTADGLSVGEHTVTLTATDSRGATGEATVTITVEANRPPSASIANPADGASFAEGETVTFEGSATDPEDGQLTGGSLVWRSDLDGELGTGETVTADGLSVGEHTVTLTATDSDGKSDAATVTITVGENQPPSVSVDRPSDQSARDEGSSITFEGSATDPEDGQLTGGSLAWSSDVDGQLGTGETVTTSTLSPGPHVITLTATDSDGARSSASIRIVVEAPGYDVRLRLLSTFSSSQESTIRDAAATWESVITGDLGAGFPSSGGACDEGGQGVDDLLVSVEAVSLDGSGGTLAQAGPCVLRGGSDLPIAGIVQIDEADLSSMESQGILGDVVEHEIAHVLGIGIGQVSGWGGRLRDLSTLDPYFTGGEANAQFDGLGGEAYLSDGVPLANTGGPGTRSAHWRQVNFENELMTGFISGNSNPLSAVTVGALRDMGYTVDLNAAEGYSLPMPQVALWESEADATLARPRDSGANFGTGGSRLASTLLAGTNADVIWNSDHPDDEVYTGLVRFGVPSLPSGVSLDYAEVELHVRDSDTNAGSTTMQLLPVTESWSESSVTWDGRPTFGSGVVSYDASCSRPCVLSSGSLVDLARSWADGSTANNGLAIEAPDASSTNFYSAGYWTRETDDEGNRPRMRVEASTGSSLQADALARPGRGTPVGDDLLLGPLYVLEADGDLRRIR